VRRRDGAIVLLVEDLHADVLLIRRAFTKSGTNVHLRVVGDGETAIDYLAGRAVHADRDQHPLPELVLLDLKLPGRSGFEVLQWLRGQPGLRRLPVAVLTSSAQAADVDRAYELGANSYLVKPVEFERLVELLKAVDLYWSANERPSLRAP
jgi:CheY-like chemotaxis protein